MVMHAYHSLVRVEIAAIDHSLIDRLARRVHVMMVAVVVMMASTQLDVMRVLAMSCIEALMVSTL